MVVQENKKKTFKTTYVVVAWSSPIHFTHVLDLLNNWVSNWSCDRGKSGLLLNVLIPWSVNCLQFNSAFRRCILKCANNGSQNVNWQNLECRVSVMVYNERYPAPVKIGCVFYIFIWISTQQKETKKFIQAIHENKNLIPTLCLGLVSCTPTLIG